MPQNPIAALTQLMDKRRFTPFERFAVYVTHNEKCYLCSHPLDLLTMEVDHVIPESLLGNPKRLIEVVRLLGRPDGFDVNSYENWLPACRGCNGRKLVEIFDPTPLIQIFLQRAQRKAQEAAQLAAKAVTQRKIATALNVLQRADERGELAEDTKILLKPLVEFQRANRAEESARSSVRLTPLYVVLAEERDFQIIHGPYGIGRKSTAANRDPSWDCSSCGSIGAWSGARCVICGAMDED